MGGLGGEQVVHHGERHLIRSYDRIPPNRIPHSETWAYFKKHLAGYLISPTTLVTDAIMTDLHDLVQEFWTISGGGVVTVDVSFTAMCCLLAIFQDDNVRYISFSFAIASTLLIQIHSQHLNSRQNIVS